MSISRYVKIPRISEKSSGIRPRHASQIRAASPGRGYLGPRAAGPPSNARANPVGCVGAGVGPWARGATRPASSGRSGSARHAGGLRRLGGPARADGRQASGPKTAGVRGHASGRRQHRTATEEPGITIISNIDVGFSRQVWSSQVREAKSRCQVKRAGRLLLSAPQLAARVPGLRGVMRWDRRSSFSGKGGRTMDGSRARRTRDRVRRAWYAAWRQYRFARHYGFLTEQRPPARICSPSHAPRVGVLP